MNLYTYVHVCMYMCALGKCIGPGQSFCLCVCVCTCGICVRCCLHLVWEQELWPKISSLFLKWKDALSYSCNVLSHLLFLLLAFSSSSSSNKWYVPRWQLYTACKHLTSLLTTRWLAKISGIKSSSFLGTHKQHI